MSAQSAPQRRQPTAQEFRDMQSSPQFAKLRSTYRSFTFPMSVAFFVWYIVYVITAIYFPGFMGQSVFGSVNVGVLFGFAQFVTTFLITWIYINYANKNIEPQAAAIREQMEG
ncbi:DUF485 domain-containing protein [Corynebacterium felinum]|uniref:Uncharacterized membrane protein (DUF485 family) n=1 Tax=Corynebacterium felinum TaxID=131318 RepID=A0ABU2BAK3_9CORY|nr:MULTISPECIES: DUF485 domain-containing protein [Corynebacterium]MDF5820276.1 DUF485 domain-containing protein [Corynebacterium felinum]MDO4761986.1 DUF485 domain-containing protein [Corynebacterium sp.]MDR7355019.1 uncharacterized membrane protein (DUF485 family) [Corynebacterium felinum]WJY94373.1 hypothetical protein CFELI_03695 [Corynebacterium felinum]